MIISEKLEPNVKANCEGCVYKSGNLCPCLFFSNFVRLLKVIKTRFSKKQFLMYDFVPSESFLRRVGVIEGIPGRYN